MRIRFRNIHVCNMGGGGIMHVHVISGCSSYGLEKAFTEQGSCLLNLGMYKDVELYPNFHCFPLQELVHFLPQ